MSGPGNLDPYSARLGQVFDLKPYTPEQIVDIRTKLGRRGLALKPMMGGLASIGLKGRPAVRATTVAEVQPGQLFTCFSTGEHMLRLKEKTLTPAGEWRLTAVFLDENDLEPGEPVSEDYSPDAEVYVP